MSDDDLTELIQRAMGGDHAAHRAVFDVTYEVLRTLARERLRRAPRGGDLDTTGLVHESYLRFAKAGRIRLEDRRHFFGYAGRVMRSVIVDEVRGRMAQRRGGDLERVTLTTGHACGVPGSEAQVLAVHAALEQLARHDQRMARVVELRYFAGMTETEIAEVLEVTDRTVRRIWERARLWLAEAMQ